jgi:hypothetical protein
VLSGPSYQLLNVLPLTDCAVKSVTPACTGCTTETQPNLAGKQTPLWLDFQYGNTVAVASPLHCCGHWGQWPPTSGPTLAGGLQVFKIAFRLEHNCLDAYTHLATRASCHRSCPVAPPFQRLSPLHRISDPPGRMADAHCSSSIHFVTATPRDCELPLPRTAINAQALPLPPWH